MPTGRSAPISTGACIAVCVCKLAPPTVNWAWKWIRPAAAFTKWCKWITARPITDSYREHIDLCLGVPRL